MNAQRSATGACRIIARTLFRDQYLDCLRALITAGDCEPFIAAVTKIQQWSAVFGYDDFDEVLASMRACNTFEQSRAQYKRPRPTT